MSSPVPPPPPPPEDGGGSWTNRPPNQPPSATPTPERAPPPAAPPPPPPQPSAGGAPAPGHGTPAPRPPRPEVRIAAVLVVVGAVVSGLAVYLPWLSVDGETQTGTGVFLTKDFELYDNPGSGVLFFAAVLLGLGIALYFAGRVLAVAIIAIVAASIALIVAIAMISIVSDTKDLAGTGSLGAGVVLLVPAAGLSLAGSIWATSRRRRW